MTTATLMAPTADGLVCLDDRERAVAVAIVHGASLELLAARLGETVLDVELTLERICRTLGVAGAPELRRLLRRWVC
jgi:hypothetical protein